VRTRVTPLPMDLVSITSNDISGVFLAVRDHEVWQCADHAFGTRFLTISSFLAV
jgi:hypothetical protein